MLFVIRCLIFHQQDWKLIDQTQVKHEVLNKKERKSGQWEAYVPNNRNSKWPQDGQYELRYVTGKRKFHRSVLLIIFLLLEFNSMFDFVLNKS